MDKLVSQVLNNLAPQADDTLKQALAEVLVPTSYSKGTILVRQGDPAPLCWFVLQGCLRMSLIREDGVESTVAFYHEGDSITILPSFRDASPSPYGLDCLEDVVLWEGDGTSQARLVNKFPALQGILMGAMEGEMNRQFQTQSRFRSLTPKERYLDFLASRPGLAARVPQHQLASYLGMQPESLSRIKKRLYQSRLMEQT